MRLFPLLASALLLTSSASAYSVLTHEALIDSAWEISIKPLLLKQYPGATADELVKAHAYAYGGAIIQDMGYYPFGSHFFSDLLHYVRSGDFVVNLIAEAQNLNDYAFALGALAHTAADNYGHSVAVNRVVPIIYPKLRAKFGPVVTYAEDPGSHLKTEFGFDVSQVARGDYAPKAYHDFIGFEVAEDALKRAFLKTYGLEYKSMFLSVELSLGTFRHSVSTTIPHMTAVAWELKKNELTKNKPGLTKRKFIYNMRRSSYEKEWGHTYQRPGIGARIMAFFFRLVPKVGPFKGFDFAPLTPSTEQMFMASFNDALQQYKTLLTETGQGALKLRNTNLDTGKSSEGGYKLADEAYARLVDKLAGTKFANVDQPLRDDILKFYQNSKATGNVKDPSKLNQELEELRILGKEKAN